MSGVYTKLLGLTMLTLLLNHLVGAENTDVCDQCIFPFTFDENDFDGCTFYERESANVSHHQPKSWCVTNETSFSDGKMTGWSYCSPSCERDFRWYLTPEDPLLSDVESFFPVEDEACNECIFPFEYGGIEFDGCTFYNWTTQNINRHQPKTWCMVNQTAFTKDSTVGWEYCSNNCKRDSRSSFEYIKLRNEEVHSDDSEIIQSSIV